MTSIERLKHFVNGNYIGKLDLNGDIETVIKDFNIQEKRITRLESDNEKLRKIINILCDTISQLI